MCEVVVEKTSTSLPSGASGSDDLFTVTGGRVIVERLFGKTTTGVTASANFDLHVDVGPINAALGSSFSLNGVPADYMISASGGSYLTGGDLGVVLKSGDVIRITTTDTASGSASWTLIYRPLDPGGSVSAA